MQTRRHRQPVERPLGREPLADLTQDRHLRVGPLDTTLAVGGEPDIGDVVAQ